MRAVWAMTDDYRAMLHGRQTLIVSYIGDEGDNGAGKLLARYGTISGTVTPDGFHILLSGQFFDAKMTVVSSPCQQSVTVVPEEGTPIKKLSSALKKC